MKTINKVDVQDEQGQAETPRAPVEVDAGLVAVALGKVCITAGRS
jgi:hypothetical protein